MANRIDLEFGGNYNLRQSFQQLDNDLKKAGRSTKDMGEAMTKVAGSAAQAFGTKLPAAASTAMSIFSEMAKGGIWGAIAVAVGSAVTFIVDKWNEAKEAARKFAEICSTNVVNAISKANESFRGVSAEVAKAKADMQDLQNVFNGRVAMDAKNKIFELHMQTMQAVADETSASGKKIIQAQADLEAANIDYAAKIRMASDNVDAAQQREALADQKLAAAKEALANVQGNYITLMNNNAAFFAKRNELQAQIAEVEQQYATNQITLNESQARLKELRLNLATLEEENSVILKLYNEATNGVKTARENVALAETESDAAVRGVTAANDALQLVTWEAKEKQQELTIKLDEAKAAQDAEIAKQKELAQKRQEEIDAKTRESAIQSEIENIKLRALELGVEANAAVEAYNLAISEGYELTTAYNIAQARLNSAVEARAEAEETASQNGEGQGGKGGGSIDRKALVEAIAEGSAQGVGSTTVNTSVNAGEVGGGVDKSGEVITLGGLQREVRDDQREARNHADQIKQSSQAMRTYMEGKMSPEVAQKFAEKLSANGLTKNELDKMVSNALKTQLIGNHEMKQQFQNIKDMKQKLEKMGLK